jgi:quinone-modifying oxidoreductase subunit QmoA
MTEVEAVSGREGAFEVKVKQHPRYVDERCTCCAKCAEVCEMEVDNPFNYNMSRMKAAYLPHPNAYPPQYVLHPDLVGSPEAQKVKDSCTYNAIHLDDEARSQTLSVSSIVWATGWQPYEASKIDYYGFGKNRNVITNVMMERLAAPDGPTGGRILRPSDGQPPAHVVFVQCAGSRDDHHLAYCSGVCCLASLKQATYVREQHPSSKVTICFIDVRAPDWLEDFYVTVQKDSGITLVRSKIADIAENPTNGELTLNGEDTMVGQRFQTTADLVVLATGIVPSQPSASLKTDDYGFLLPSQDAGHFPAGCAARPTEVSSTVQDATAAALRAIQTSVAR